VLYQIFLLKTPASGQAIELANLRKLLEIPTSYSLVDTLEIRLCPELTEISCLSSISQLKISHCCFLSSICHLSDMDSLHISNCDHLIEIYNLFDIRSLTVEHCIELDDINNLGVDLNRVEISKCTKIIHRFSDGRYEEMMKVIPQFSCQFDSWCGLDTVLVFLIRATNSLSCIKCRKEKIMFRKNSIRRVPTVLPVLIV
jgi:hypothetical protein